jgi:hypothetical protein
MYNLKLESSKFALDPIREQTGKLCQIKPSSIEKATQRGADLRTRGFCRDNRAD